MDDVLQALLGAALWAWLIWMVAREVRVIRYDDNHPLADDDGSGVVDDA
jgi:hypothetical protein